MNRRGFVGLTLASLGSSLLEPASGARLVEKVSGIKAVAFDAFAIFDPRPVWSLAEELFPGSGSKLSEVWRVRQFEFSTDAVKTYKPDPPAYQLAMDAWRLARQEIAFVAFAGWDAAGAKLFGYPTFWVNRLRLPAEELGVSADVTGEELSHLVDFVQRRGLR